MSMEIQTYCIHQLEVSASSPKGDDCLDLNPIEDDGCGDAGLL